MLEIAIKTREIEQYSLFCYLQTCTIMRNHNLELYSEHKIFKAGIWQRKMQKLDIIYLAFNLKIGSGICFSFFVSCVLVVGKGWKKRSQHVKRLRQRGGSSRKSYINLKWSRKDK